MFKVNNKDTRTTSLCFGLYIVKFEHIFFISFSDVPIVDFDQYRSSHRRCSVKKGVIRNFEKFAGKHLCQSVFFYKAAGLRPATLLKKRL